MAYSYDSQNGLTAERRHRAFVPVVATLINNSPTVEIRSKLYASLSSLMSLSKEKIILESNQHQAFTALQHAEPDESQLVLLFQLLSIVRLKNPQPRPVSLSSPMPSLPTSAVKVMVNFPIKNAELPPFEEVYSNTKNHIAELQKAINPTSCCRVNITSQTYVKYCEELAKLIGGLVVKISGDGFTDSELNRVLKNVFPGKISSIELIELEDFVVTYFQQTNLEHLFIQKVQHLIKICPYKDKNAETVAKHLNYKPVILLDVPPEHQTKLYGGKERWDRFINDRNVITSWLFDLDFTLRLYKKYGVNNPTKIQNCFNLNRFFNSIVLAENGVVMRLPTFRMYKFLEAFKREGFSALSNPIWIKTFTIAMLSMNMGDLEILIDNMTADCFIWKSLQKYFTPLTYSDNKYHAMFLWMKVLQADNEFVQMIALNVLTVYSNIFKDVSSESEKLFNSCLVSISARIKNYYLDYESPMYAALQERYSSTKPYITNDPLWSLIQQGKINSSNTMQEVEKKYIHAELFKQSDKEKYCYLNLSGLDFYNMSCCWQLKFICFRSATFHKCRFHCPDLNCSDFDGSNLITGVSGGSNNFFDASFGKETPTVLRKDNPAYIARRRRAAEVEAMLAEYNKPKEKPKQKSNSEEDFVIARTDVRAEKELPTYEFNEVVNVESSPPPRRATLSPQYATFGSWLPSQQQTTQVRIHSLAPNRPASAAIPTTSATPPPHRSLPMPPNRPASAAIPATSATPPPSRSLPSLPTRKAAQPPQTTQKNE
jgi:hypothetical protein